MHTSRDPDDPRPAVLRQLAELLERDCPPREAAEPAIETVRTRDLTLHLPDGSTETRRARPRGSGWRIAEDQERHTVWTRRKAGGAP